MTPTTRKRLRRLADRLLILSRPAILWTICISFLFFATRTEPVDVLCTVVGLFFLGPAVYSTEEAILDWSLTKALDEFEDLWHDRVKGES